MIADALPCVQTAAVSAGPHITFGNYMSVERERESLFPHFLHSYKAINRSRQELYAILS